MLPIDVMNCGDFTHASSDVFKAAILAHGSVSTIQEVLDTINDAANNMTAPGYINLPRLCVLWICRHVHILKNGGPDAGRFGC